MPKTRIICTLGPASNTPAELRKMMRAGMDVVRLNFSHGKPEDHLARIKLVRALNRKNRRHIRLLGDLEGYRIRVGQFKDGRPFEVKKHQIVRLVPGHIAPGGTGVIPFDYTGPLAQIKKGHTIFIDDGNIALVVEKVGPKAIHASVVVAGSIKDHKGINMPDTQLNFKGLTSRDKANLAFALEQKMDFVAQSFVRTEADIQVLRTFIRGAAHQPKVIAKIENREGIQNIDAIIKVSDGIMIARGDMGVSLPIWEVPMIQKAIIRKCNLAGKPVITATQMLESMTENRIPTRAEVTDVANAILDGTDYVMLSGETAIGVSPSGCVEMMNRIIVFTEEYAG